MTKDEILERFRACIPLKRPLSFECPVEEMRVPLRWLALIVAEMDGFRFELSEAQGAIEAGQMENTRLRAELRKFAPASAPAAERD